MYNQSDIEQIIALLTQKPESGDEKIDPKAPTPFRELKLKCKPLVNNIASRYVNQQKGLDFEDLVAYGERGLLKAMNNFNEKVISDVESYLAKSIKFSILDKIRDNKALKIPDSFRRKIRKVKSISERLSKETGVAPEPLEIAEQLEMPESEVIKILNFSIIKDTEYDDRNSSPGSDIAGSAELEQRYIHRLEISDRNILGYFKNNDKKLTNYEISEKLDLSTGQLDREKARVRNILYAMIEHDLGSNNIPKEYRRWKRKTKKSKPKHSPESESEFINRISKIGFRIFPDVLPLINIRIDTGNKKIMTARGKYRINITSTPDGELIVTLDEARAEERLPPVYQFMLNLKPGDDKTKTIDVSDIPLESNLLNFVKKHAPTVYQHQMREFLKALDSTGTANNYCNKREVKFKTDELEPIFKSIDKYMEKPDNNSIYFEDLEKIIGITKEEIIELDHDGKIQFPYTINYIGQELVRLV